MELHGGKGGGQKKLPAAAQILSLANGYQEGGASCFVGEKADIVRECLVTRNHGRITMQRSRKGARTGLTHPKKTQLTVGNGRKTRSPQDFAWRQDK